MKRMPTMVGTIERRLLVNYRVDPDVLRRILPEPFRPQLVAGVGVAGICLIRLGHLRPPGLPRRMGLTTENAAHRVAVEWDGPGGLCRGVYIPRRDTSSRITTVVGGRFFPGHHHRAQFRVDETESRCEVAFSSLDGTATVTVAARSATRLPAGSVFTSMAEASAFFQEGSLGYSATRTSGRYDGIELCCRVWRMEPMRAEHVESSFFDDDRLFPSGSAQLDSAFLMRGIPAAWETREQLTAAPVDVVHDARVSELLIHGRGDRPRPLTVTVVRTRRPCV